MAFTRAGSRKMPNRKELRISKINFILTKEGVLLYCGRNYQRLTVHILQLFSYESYFELYLVIWLPAWNGQIWAMIKWYSIENLLWHALFSVTSKFSLHKEVVTEMTEGNLAQLVLASCPTANGILCRKWSSFCVEDDQNHTVFHRRGCREWGDTISFPLPNTSGIASHMHSKLSHT